MFFLTFYYVADIISFYNCYSESLKMSMSINLDFVSSAFKAVSRTGDIDIVPKQKAPDYASSFDLDTLHARSLQWSKVSREVSPSPSAPVRLRAVSKASPAPSVASPPVSKSGDRAPSGVSPGPVTRSRKRKLEWSGEINVLDRTKTLKFNVDLGDHSVLDVKLKIQDKVGFAPEQQELYLFGSQLENGKKLEDSGVQIGED